MGLVGHGCCCHAVPGRVAVELDRLRLVAVVGKLHAQHVDVDFQLGLVVVGFVGDAVPQHRRLDLDLDLDVSVHDARADGGAGGYDAGSCCHSGAYDGAPRRDHVGSYRYPGGHDVDRDPSHGDARGDAQHDVALDVYRRLQ